MAHLCLLAHRGELSLVLASQIPESLLSGICLATCSVLSLQVTRMQFLLHLCPPGNSSECPLVWASQIPDRLLSGICLAHSSGISLLLARRHKMSPNCFLATGSEVSLELASWLFCHIICLLALRGQISLVVARLFYYLCIFYVILNYHTLL